MNWVGAGVGARPSCPPCFTGRGRRLAVFQRLQLLLHRAHLAAQGGQLWRDRIDGLFLLGRTEPVPPPCTERFACPQ